MLHNKTRDEVPFRPVNLSYGDIQKCRKLLAVETPSPVAKIKSAWNATPVTCEMDREKIESLCELRRAEQAQMIEKWINKGLWAPCRSDEEYPQRLKTHLKRLAPPILYGAGDRSLLSKGGLARGRLAPYQSRSRIIRNGQLVLVSTHNPEAGFSIGNAMGRNKYIYALAEYAVVVSSDFEKGGTYCLRIVQRGLPLPRQAPHRPCREHASSRVTPHSGRGMHRVACSPDETGT